MLPPLVVAPTVAASATSRTFACAWPSAAAGRLYVTTLLYA